MEYRTLGRTGLKVSAIAMGTFSFGGVGAFSRVANQGVADARRLIDCCIDGGVNLFDTDNMYSLGRSEEILGEALSPDTWIVRLYWKPLIDWIWGGCLLMALGGGLAAADRRYRLSARSAPSAAGDAAIASAVGAADARR